MKSLVIKMLGKVSLPDDTTSLIPGASAGEAITITNVINFFLYVVGIAAVVMIIYGGFLYTSSAGDSGKVAKAKNTILWAVIGLVVVILSYAIVNFVITTLQ